MPDSERLVDLRHECPRCKAHDACIPQEALLRALIEEDWDATKETFTPRLMTQPQAVAAELLTTAMARYIAAFGVDLTGTRVNVLLMFLRSQARLARATARILEARAEINSRARERYERGDIEGAHAIEAEPTPDYPGRARDQKLLEVGL
jgi:hypothetical protein